MPVIEVSMTMAWDEVVLSVAQMGQADAWAVNAGVSGVALMDRAGSGMCDAITRRWARRPVVVLCGPGNNGGDGLVVARKLSEQGWPVTVALWAPVADLKGDALHHARLWLQAQATAPTAARTVPLAELSLNGCALVVDALFGAGLSRPLDALCTRVLTQARALGVPVVAADVPSGLHGDLARTLDGQPLPAPADLTVTFMAPKPAHVLMPGKAACGEVVLVDIGIAPGALPTLGSVLAPHVPLMRRNSPTLWQPVWPSPAIDAHKYRRGHALVFSGARMVGAARLTSRAAARVGAGLVTLAVPAQAWAVVAPTLWSTMAQSLDDPTPEALLSHWSACLTGHRWAAVAIGPGARAGLPVNAAHLGGDDGADTLRQLVLCLLAAPIDAGVVLDADALMVFESQPEVLMSALRARLQARPLAPPVVLTPHEGEFTRLFGPSDQDKITRTRQAAERSGAVVLHKGPDTVVVSPSGEVVINTLAPVWLATAGSGDVLTGLITGLLAQGVPALQAACAAAWLHGAAAQAFGPGLIAEDLPEQVPGLLRRLWC